MVDIMIISMKMGKDMRKKIDEYISQWKLDCYNGNISNDTLMNRIEYLEFTIQLVDFSGNENQDNLEISQLVYDCERTYP